MAADNIYKLLEQLNDNISDIRKYSGYHPGETTNPVVKFIRRVRAKLSGQVQYDQAVERAIMDIYNIEARLHQYTVSMFETFNDANYHKICDEKGPRIIQLVSTVNYGDAVGNDVIAIQNALRGAGYTTAIFAETIHPKIPSGTVFSIEILPALREDDVILYHFAAEDHFEEFIKKAPCKVVLRYHNVTPPHFFDGYDAKAKLNTERGLAEIKALKDDIDYGIVVSEFNRDDLISYGYKCPIDVAPILVQFDDYRQTPNQKVIEKYKDEKHNVLFVGRMAPNKKVEDVISSFAEYKKTYDRDARLFLVGSFQETDKYYNELLRHIDKLGVEDVIFPGHIGFDEILAYYSIADLFLCMSEHEGFCVPLVEAMFFGVPIVAYDSCAVPNTLGGSGCLVHQKDYKDIANKMFDIVNNADRQKTLIDGQNNRLKAFEHGVIEKQILDFLKNYI